MLLVSEYQIISPPPVFHVRSSPARKVIGSQWNSWLSFREQQELFIRSPDQLVDYQDPNTLDLCFRECQLPIHSHRTRSVLIIPQFNLSTKKYRV